MENLMFTSERSTPDFVVENGIPQSSIRRFKYPFAEMKVGQSFEYPKKINSTVKSFAAYYARKHPPYHFSFRKQPRSKYRVWRVS